MLHAPAHAAQARRLGVPDGDDEVRPDEYVQLAELHLLRGVEVAGGSQHDEQGVAVALELRALMAGQRILDGQLVQAELGGDLAHLHLAGPVQADPAHAVAIAHEPERLGQGVRGVGADTVT